MTIHNFQKELINLLNQPFDESILCQANSEAWFSNELAWLLDPKGSHGFGVKFVQDFVALIGEKRSASNDYRRRKAYLKKGKSKHGTGVTSFNLANCAVFREFYLSKRQKRKRDGGLFCDVVLMDLDSSDGLFVTIENKLYTTDHKGQLKEYYGLIEEKYSRAKVREYIYLTLNGDKPKYLDEMSGQKNWVQVSWLNDVHALLKNLLEHSDHKNPSVISFVQHLNWMRDIEGFLERSETNLTSTLLSGAKDCLLEELQRLSGTKRGEWSSGRANFSIKHSSRKSALHLSLLPGLSVAIHGKSKQKSEFEKILIPFGAHPDQVFNLLDIAARDIYHLFFSEASIYLDEKRRLRTGLTEEKEKWKDYLSFVYKHRKSLPFVLAIESIKRNDTNLLLPSIEELPPIIN